MASVAKLIPTTDLKKSKYWTSFTSNSRFSKAESISQETKLFSCLNLCASTVPEVQMKHQNYLYVFPNGRYIKYSNEKIWPAK